MHFDFTAAGIRFRGDTRNPFVVFGRSQGQIRPFRVAWGANESWSTIDTASRVFQRLVEVHERSYIYGLNVTTQELVALGVEGRLIYSYINPNAIFDSREPA